MSKRKLNLLLLSSGGPGAKGVIQSLKKSSFDISFYGMDSDRHSQNQNFVNKFLLCSKRKNKNKLLQEIKDCFYKFNIDLIYPLSSDDILFFIKNKDFIDKEIFESLIIFDNNYNVLTDKEKTYQAISQKNYCPKYFCISDIDDFKKESMVISGPLYVKPKSGSGSRENFLIKEKIKISDYLGKKNCNIISKDQFLSIVEDIDNYIFCEFLPGKEYSIDVFSDTGKTIASCIRVREKVSSGVSSVSIVENSEAVIEVIEDIVKTFKLDGASNIQIKQDKNNKLKLVEINPRTSGSICVSFNAGVNIVDLVLRKYLSLEYENIYPKLSKEIRMIRYQDEFYTTR